MVKKLLAAAGLSLTLVPLLPATAIGAPKQITEASAKQIALSNAGLSERNLALIYAKLDWDDGRPVYDVEFYTPDYAEYDYEIDAYTGAILSIDYEAESITSAGQSGGLAAAAPTQPSAPFQTAATSAISLEQAKAIALNQAGLSDSQVVFVKANQEQDDGRLLYECEFVYKTT
ncbi:MAG: PepSY domain-containing protein, partial [Clostridiales bacterium]|nr:PepSY domain-containing protein [Clostridiales bacterium]